MCEFGIQLELNRSSSTHHTFLIIGSGTAAEAAIRAIREIDENSSIGVITKGDRVHNRWTLISGDSLSADAQDQAEPSGDDWNITYHLNREVTAIFPDSKTVLDDKEEIYTYHKLLIATGDKPRRLQDGDDDALGHIVYPRTVGDLQQIRAMCGQDLNFGVIGGGFIGTELASALVQRGMCVSMFFPEPNMLHEILPETIGRKVLSMFRDNGVNVYAQESIVSVDMIGQEMVLRTSKGNVINFGAVVAGLGSTPEHGLARNAGLHVETGIIVDSKCRTSQSDIYAAGAVSQFTNPALGTSLRFDHVENAQAMGDIAGRNMAGQPAIYDIIPMFRTRFFDVVIEAIGDVSSRLSYVIDWNEDKDKGIIYYLAVSRVRGVLFWNVPSNAEAASNLIRSEGIFNSNTLKGRIPLD